VIEAVAMEGGIGHEQGGSVEPDEAVVAQPPNCTFNGFLVANFSAHFGHRAVVRMDGQNQGEDRPLGLYVLV
jgi:hypothetical protein